MKRILTLMLCMIMIASLITTAYAKTEKSDTEISIADMDTSLYEGNWITFSEDLVFYVPKDYTVVETDKVVFTNSVNGMSFTVSDVSNQYKTLEEVEEKNSKENKLNITRAIINGKKAVLYYNSNVTRARSKSIRIKSYRTAVLGTYSTGNRLNVFIEVQEGTIMSLVVDKGNATDEEFSDLCKTLVASISDAEEAEAEESSSATTVDKGNNSETSSGDADKTGDNFNVLFLIFVALSASVVGTMTYVVSRKKNIKHW